MSLSDKRQELSNYGLQHTESLGGAAKFYSEEDIKKAVQELKKTIQKNKPVKMYGRNIIQMDNNKLAILIYNEFIEIIDKIFGDKLI